MVALYSIEIASYLAMTRVFKPAKYSCTSIYNKRKKSDDLSTTALSSFINQSTQQQSVLITAVVIMVTMVMIIITVMVPVIVVPAVSVSFVYHAT
jgi:hypothetical protein